MRVRLEAHLFGWMGGWMDGWMDGWERTRWAQVILIPCPPPPCDCHLPVTNPA